MKDWNNLQADQNLLMNKHYTPGRAGHSINKIVLHHNAGRLSIQECWNVWQTREASAHYQIDTNGRVGQLVWDRDTAWHAGNWDANTTSIGIEHANNHTGEPWTISDATLENGAHLVAAICRYYKLGRPAWGKTSSDTKTSPQPPAQVKSQEAKTASIWLAPNTGTTT